LDGEGSISIVRVAEKNHPRYFLALNVSNTSKTILDDMKQFFGGIGSNILGRVRVSGRKPVWQWTVKEYEAGAIIERLLPCLRLKKTQAILALEFLEKRKPVENQKRRFGVCNSELQKRERYYLKMRELNKRGNRETSPRAGRPKKLETNV